MNFTDTRTDAERRASGATRSATAAPSDQGERPNPLGLSAPQVVGGALAAMTAAALGSQLSVAGTIIGAAVASIVAAVAGAVYTTSIRHTGNKVKTVWKGYVGDTRTVVEPLPDAAAATDAGEAPARPDGWATTTAPSTAGGRTTIGPAGSGQSTASSQATRVVATVDRPASRAPKLLRRVLVGAVATFALAAGALTGLELLTGHALSGGTGTTVEQVREAGTGGGRDEPASAEPSAEAPSAAAEDSESTEPAPSQPSDETSTQPDGSPSTEASQAPAEPTADPSAAEEPSVEPSSPNGSGAPELGGLSEGGQ